MANNTKNIIHTSVTTSKSNNDRRSVRALVAVIGWFPLRKLLKTNFILHSDCALSLNNDNIIKDNTNEEHCINNSMILLPLNNDDWNFHYKGLDSTTEDDYYSLSKYKIPASLTNAIHVNTKL